MTLRERLADWIELAAQRREALNEIAADASYAGAAAGADIISVAGGAE